MRSGKGRREINENTKEKRGWRKRKREKKKKKTPTPTRQIPLLGPSQNVNFFSHPVMTNMKETPSKTRVWDRDMDMAPHVCLSRDLHAIGSGSGLVCPSILCRMPFNAHALPSVSSLGGYRFIFLFFSSHITSLICSESSCRCACPSCYLLKSSRRPRPRSIWLDGSSCTLRS